ncbi:DUF4099 domain-containing protein [Dysgonomonas reticulitermitis]
MDTKDNKAPFTERDVNWDELAAIGILRNGLEQDGNLEPLLKGEKTGVISMQLILLGVDVEMDATLQLVRKGEEPVLEITGISPADMDR